MNNLLSKIKKGPTKLPPKIMLIGVEGRGQVHRRRVDAEPHLHLRRVRPCRAAVRGIPNFTPESWKDILDFCEELAQTPRATSALVIDTLDWVEPMLYAHVCAEGKQKNIEGFGYGKGYVLAQQEARKLLVAGQGQPRGAEHPAPLALAAPQGAERAGRRLRPLRAS